MAKTPNLKKSSKPPSLHSRASKRAPSPPALGAEKFPADRPSVLSTHHGAGVTKRKAKGKAMSRQQRLRQERGMERAEAVRDVRAKKVEKSLGRGKVGRERGAAWEELNAKIAGRRSKAKDEAKVEDRDDWEDDDLEEAGAEDGKNGGDGEDGLVVEPGDEIL
ncbi:hypothetical protein MMC22_011950 [Lobaria immixta]|nr:hypothetical protein [Lobaria immixta]